MLVDSTATEVQDADYAEPPINVIQQPALSSPHSPPTWVVSPPTDDPNRWQKRKVRSIDYLISQSGTPLRPDAL